MRGHVDARRPFKPHSGGGGSKPGKAQNRWPLFALVAAEAIYRRAAGGQERLLHDRRWTSFGADAKGLFLKREMERLFPGFWAYLATRFKPTKTPPWANLHNRVYKMYYNGTSARGYQHDPRTRASVSVEHWTCRVPEGSVLIELHTLIDQGRVDSLPDWMDSWPRVNH